MICLEKLNIKLFLYYFRNHYILNNIVNYSIFLNYDEKTKNNVKSYIYYLKLENYNFVFIFYFYINLMKYFICLMY